jgi:YYY domain-containing protein
MRESQSAESSEMPEPSRAGAGALAPAENASDRKPGFVIDDYSSNRPELITRLKRPPFPSIPSIPSIPAIPGISTRYALVLILLLAIALRLYGINWDQGGLFHPDERAFLSQVYNLEFPEGDEWSDVLDPDASTLNPGSFNWGSLPHYALKAVHYAVAPYEWMSLFDLRFAGRALSAFSDVATVFFVFLIGRAVFSSRVGLLAAGLSAIAVQQVQLSHFFAVDTFMTTFIVATIYYSLRVAHEGRRRDSVLAGVMFGLAVTTKFSSLPLGIAVVLAHVIFATSRSGDRYDSDGVGSDVGATRQWLTYKNALVSMIVFVAVLVVAQPYMFLDFSTFIDNISTQGQMVRREVDFPFTRQYEDTPKYIYQMVQLGTWGLGPVLGIVVWLGLLGAVVAAVLAQRKTDLVILAWVLPYLLITGWFDVKFMRYMMPITPFLILYGARTLWWAFEVIRSLQPNRRWLQALPIAIVLIFTVHYSLSFMSVYSGAHPLNDVSSWLKSNAEPGSKVVQEHWEEGIPGVVGLQMHDRAELYNDESPQKFNRLTKLLADSDYFVLLSNRLYATIPRLPDRYPITSTFYEKLFTGELGYEMAYAGGRYVGGLGIDYYEDPFARLDFGPPERFQRPSDGLFTAGFGWADESFSVYEHPQTFVFANIDHLSTEQLGIEIGSAKADAQVFRPQEIGLLLSDEEAEAQQSGGTWSSITFLRWMPDWLTPIVWYVAAQLFALVVLPIAFVVFRSWPDRGYLLAKPLGLLLVATVTWLLVSVGVIQFSFFAVLLGLLLLAAISYWTIRVTGSDFKNHLRANSRRIVRMEVLILVAYVAFLLIRSANPDLWHPWKGGEKPMDFAYLNAVLKSSTIPPYDPWYAGGYLNYYYFGQFMVASLIRFTGIVPSVAYNLAVPLLFAMTVGGVYSIVSGLAEMTLRARRVPAWSRRSPVYAGLVAVVFVAVAGNIDGLTQVLQGATRSLFLDQSFGQFDFWRSSRMMAPGSPGNEITEFPFFTFLFADLHAHLIAIPIAITALAAAISAYLRIGRKRPVAESLAGLIVLGVLVGSLRAINAWDFPTQLLLAGGFLIGGQLISSNKSVIERLFIGGASTAFVLLVGHVVFLPFHASFELFNNGVIKSQFTTELWRYITIHSIFLFVIISWLVFMWRERLSSALASVTNAPLPGSGIGGWAWQFVVVLVAAMIATLALAGFATIGFTVIVGASVLGAGLTAFRSRLVGARYSLIAVGMVVMAMALAAGVDMFTVKDDIGRMNTVFKFYLQAWILLAMASAYFLWVLGDAGKLSFSNLRVGRSFWLGVFAVLVIGVMVYPVLGTRHRNAQRFEFSGLALDGMAYMETVTYNDHEGPLTLKYDFDAIEWMQQNVEGSPVIVEGLNDQYRWGNRVSIYTGLPAIIGWDWHQRQQRVGYAATVTKRRAEVDRFFHSMHLLQAVSFLDKYNVKYVYIGEMERAKYSETGLKKFAEMEANGLVQVYPTPESLAVNGDTPVVVYEYTAVE